MSSFADTLRQLGPSRLGIMAGIFVVLLLFFVFVSMQVSAPSMKLLYSDLSSVDSGAIAAKLQEAGIAFEVSQDGERIMAAEDEIGKARMLLAEAGLPNGGSMGYELFDKSSGFGTTTMVQNINQIRALEGELARTISSMSSIRSARVHLVLPQRELFSRDDRASSASVFISVRPGNKIERQKIQAIQSLVSSAVQDLKPSSVSIVDSNGNLLAQGEDEGADVISVQAEEKRLNYERRLTSKIEDQVSRIVGYGNVRATVTSEINFDRINTNEELYDPEGQVLRSTQVTEESSSDQEGAVGGSGAVGVANNLPGGGQDLLTDSGGVASSSNRTEEVSNFEISKTIRSITREVGEVQKVSVAVLIDGSYDMVEATEEGGEPVKTYVPRTEEEIQQIENLVKSAVGFDADRGDTVEVINMRFAEIDTVDEFQDEGLMFGFNKDKLLDLAEIGIVSVLVILIVMLVLQPIVNRLLEAAASRPAPPPVPSAHHLLPGGQASPALTAPDKAISALPPQQEEEEEEESLISVAGVDGKVKASSVKKVEEIVTNYPNETLSVVRSWMNQQD